jgi:hypothetical protein
MILAKWVCVWLIVATIDSTAPLGVDDYPDHRPCPQPDLLNTLSNLLAEAGGTPGAAAAVAAEAAAAAAAEAATAAAAAAELFNNASLARKDSGAVQCFPSQYSVVFSSAFRAQRAAVAATAELFNNASLARQETGAVGVYCVL